MAALLDALNGEGFLDLGFAVETEIDATPLVIAPPVMLGVPTNGTVDGGRRTLRGGVEEHGDRLRIELHQTGLTERGIASSCLGLLSDHDMIQHLNPYNLAGLDQLLSQLNILGRR
jgi:hypothetical protein